VGPKTCMDPGEFPGLRRVPRTGVTLREAAEACEARGVRLCARSEWQHACAGPRHNRFPYGPALVPDTCNTASAAGFPQEIGPSGAWERCVTPAGIHDLVGNAGEWVAEGVALGGDSSTPGSDAHCAAQGRPPPAYAGADLGFRCCADAAPTPGAAPKRR
jgi:formylglycine-generating enzyme required for sulfatase activity